MAEWRFGEILSNGFQSEYQSGFSELSPDAGSTYRREEFTDIQDLISGSFVLDIDAYRDFKDWYKNDIRQGSLKFDYYDCITRQTRQAQILGNPTFSTVSNLFYVNITLALDSVTYVESFNLLDEAGIPVLDESGENILTEVEITI